MNLRTRIVGTGRAVPGKVLTNDDLAGMVDTSDAWISERTGIRRRHILEENRVTSDLVAEAARKAAERAGWDPKDIECLILGTVTGDMPMPATAVFAQAKLG